MNVFSYIFVLFLFTFYFFDFANSVTGSCSYLISKQKIKNWIIKVAARLNNSGTPKTEIECYAETSVTVYHTTSHSWRRYTVLILMA
jgi:hypothetical protein